MKKFEQTKNFIKRVIRIEETRVLYEVSYQGNSVEHEIEYEHLYKLKTTVRTNKRGWLIAGIVLSMVGGMYMGIPDYMPIEVSLTLCLIGLVAIVIWHRSKEELWNLKNDTAIAVLLHKSIPSREEVNSALDSLYESRDRYLLKEYNQFDLRLRYAAILQNINQLKRLEVFDDEQYRKRKLELDEYYNIRSKDIDTTSFGMN